METYHNSVPEPVIHRITQRAGTNILELDFEVIVEGDKESKMAGLTQLRKEVIMDMEDFAENEVSAADTTPDSPLPLPQGRDPFIFSLAAHVAGGQWPTELQL